MSAEDTYRNPSDTTPLNFGTLKEQARLATDEVLRSDLELSSQIASELAGYGAAAFVVGGYVRDLARSYIMGEAVVTSDIDFVAFGIEADVLAAILEQYGPVHVVGEAFKVYKFTNPSTGSQVDFSLPQIDESTPPTDTGLLSRPIYQLAVAAKGRDVTINALTLDPLTGEIIDPFGGVDDLRRGVIRAVDIKHFADDPLRVLRVMRLSGSLDMVVDAELVQLCRGIDLSNIAAERIGGEWLKGLIMARTPSVTLQAALELGVVDKLHPELSALVGVPQDPLKHPEGDVWTHTKLVVDAAARIMREEQLAIDDATSLMLAALCHDLGKPVSTRVGERGTLIAHGHEVTGLEPTKSFLKSIRMPKDVISTVVALVKAHLFMHSLPKGETPSDKVLKNFAHRLKPANAYLWDLLCRADSNGRGLAWQDTASSHAVYSRMKDLKLDLEIPKPVVQGRDLIALGLKPGPKLGLILSQLHQAQISGEFETVEAGIQYWLDHDKLQHIVEAEDG